MGVAPSFMGLPSFMGFPSFMSFGSGLPSTKVLDTVTDTFYNRLVQKEIKSFEDFHVAILELFSTFNSALPGKHYEVPSREEVEKCYESWEKLGSREEKKRELVKFMKTSFKLSKLDHYTLMTGVLTPPVAMAAKKAGESVPQLKIIKVVPDVVFVPTATVIALITAKLSRKMFHSPTTP